MKAIKLFSRRQMVFNLLSIFVIASMLAFGSSLNVAAKGSASQEPKPPQPTAEQALLDQCLSAQGQVSYQALTGKINFAGTNPSEPIQQPIEGLRSATPEEAARGYLSQCGSLFGLSNQADELIVKRQTKVEDGRSVFRFQQTYQTIPVFGGELVVQLNAANDILMVNGEILPDIQLDTQAGIEADAAQQEALQIVAAKHNLNSEALKVSTPELWVYSPVLFHQEGLTSLVWRMEITPVEIAPIRELVLVDAHSGAVVLNINQVDEARDRRTYNMYNGISVGYLICDESNPTCSGGDTDAVNAHIYAGDVYDFYYSLFGRDSINNAGMTIKSFTHFSSGFCNAFWDGYEMVYGDGCFLVADDVVGHEMTHGVTDYESGLVYSYQSGAINESLSDIFGEFIDLGNGSGNDTPAVRWLMGEDTSIGAIRSLKNPPVYYQPDRMGSPYYYTGSDDDGGVHTNSGVGNKAAYLIVDGDTFNGYTVNGIGVAKAAYIYYEAQTNILTSGSQYADLGNALYQACNNLVGLHSISAADCVEVRKATVATEMVAPPHLLISGNAGIAGATLSYTDGTPKTTTSLANGNYSFMVSYNWSGVVTPTKACYIFSPLNRSYSNVVTDQTSQNYTYALQSGAGCANITISLAGIAQGIYAIPSPGSDRQSFVGANNGPVKLVGNVNIISAQRILYYGTGAATSFVEMMGLPNGQLDTTYWFPWYKNDGIVDTQLRIGNVSGSAATVHIYVAGVEVPGSPFTLTTSGAGQSQRLSFALNDGPVKVVSNVPIVTTERLIYFQSGVPISFSEMLGLPNSQLSTTYWFPWYKNVGDGIDTQLRIGNVSGSTASVHIYIGGVEMTGSPFTLTATGAGQSLRVSFTANNGPVKIVSDQNIVAAQRILYYAGGVPTSFVEMMGLPNGQLSTTHWFPWYKNVGDGIDTQIRIGNVSGAAASVHVYIGGAEMAGSPFALTATGAGQSLRLNFTANNGPLKLVSTQNIVASERLIYSTSGVATSFSEMMGLPNTQLSTTYWLPWYKNIGEIDTQLRFATP